MRKNNLLILSVLLLLLAPSVRAAGSAESRPTVDELVALFETVVFGREHGLEAYSEQIIKWDGDILIREVGKTTRRNRKILRRHTRRVERLTGLSIKYVVDATQQENMVVGFLPALEMARPPWIHGNQEFLDQLAGPRSCYFLVKNTPEGKILNSVIIANSDLDLTSIYHCLLEELIQSIGLPNDTDMLRPSIFSDRDRLARISRSDEVLIRTLYDPRMVAGLEKTEALKVARVIIAEWNSVIPLR